MRDEPKERLRRRLCVEGQWTPVYAMSEVPCASVPKGFLVKNISYEDDFDVRENEPEGETHF